MLVYLRTAEGNDALAWVDKDGDSVTESQFAILKAAECEPDTPALPRQENHHELVAKASSIIAAEEKTVGGQLGRPSGARFRTYERLKRYAERGQGHAVRHAGARQGHRGHLPLSRCASRPTDTLNRQLRSGISRRRAGRAGRRAARGRPAVLDPRRRADRRAADHLLAGPGAPNG